MTFGSGGAVQVPKLKVPGEDKRFQDLSKLVKQLGISIPKRFDSKLQLREFFYQRDFILNLKIKMNNVLHSAILHANHLDSEE